MQIPHRFHKQPKLFYFAAKEVHFKILTHSFATHQMMCIFANHKHITNMNMNGQYTIQSKKGETLLFQYIGYKQEKRVVKSSTLDVKMKALDVKMKAEVVGYGHELRATKSMSTAYMAVCPASGIMYNAVNAEEYGEILENGFKNVSDAPLSTFSIDVDACFL